MVPHTQAVRARRLLLGWVAVQDVVIALQPQRQKRWQHGVSGNTPCCTLHTTQTVNPKINLKPLTPSTCMGGQAQMNICSNPSCWTYDR